MKKSAGITMQITISSNLSSGPCFSSCRPFLPLPPHPSILAPHDRLYQLPELMYHSQIWRNTSVICPRRNTSVIRPPRPRQRRHNPEPAQSIIERTIPTILPCRTRRIIRTHILRHGHRVRHHLLRGGAPLIEHIIQRDADADAVPQMRDRIRAWHPTDGRRCIHDRVDEVVDRDSRQVHESVYMCLGGGPRVSRDGGVGATQDGGKKVVESHHHAVLV